MYICFTVLCTDIVGWAQPHVNYQLTHPHLRHIPILNPHHHQSVHGSGWGGVLFKRSVSVQYLGYRSGWGKESD